MMACMGQGVCHACEGSEADEGWEREMEEQREMEEMEWEEEESAGAQEAMGEPGHGDASAEGAGVTAEATCERTREDKGHEGGKERDTTENGGAGTGRGMRSPGQDDGDTQTGGEAEEEREAATADPTAAYWQPRRANGSPGQDNRQNTLGLRAAGVGGAPSDEASENGQSVMTLPGTAPAAETRHARGAREAGEGGDTTGGQGDGGRHTEEGAAGGRGTQSGPSEMTTRPTGARGTWPIADRGGGGTKRKRGTYVAALERQIWRDRLAECGAEEWQQARREAQGLAAREGRPLAGAPRICQHCGKHGHTVEHCQVKEKEELAAKVARRRIRIIYEGRAARRAAAPGNQGSHTGKEGAEGTDERPQGTPEGQARKGIREPEGDEEEEGAWWAETSHTK